MVLKEWKLSFQHSPGDKPISCVSEPRKFFTQPPDESLSWLVTLFQPLEIHRRRNWFSQLG